MGLKLNGRLGSGFNGATTLESWKTKQCPYLPAAAVMLQ